MVGSKYCIIFSFIFKSCNSPIHSEWVVIKYNQVVGMQTAEQGEKPSETANDICSQGSC